MEKKLSIFNPIKTIRKVHEHNSTPTISNAGNNSSNSNNKSTILTNQNTNSSSVTNVGPSSRLQSSISILMSNSTGKKPEYLLYYDEKDPQSKIIIEYLENSLDKNQVMYVTAPPTDNDLKKIAYMMDIDDQKMLHAKGVLSDDDLKRTQKGDNELIAKRLIEKKYAANIRPILLCPLKGEVVIQGTLELIKEMIAGSTALAW